MSERWADGRSAATAPQRRALDLSRRELLARAGVGTAALALGAAGWGCGSDAGPRPDAGAFALGVASGDPEPDGVVLWTRLAPEPMAGDGRGGMPDRPVAVRWEMAEDERFARPVRRGTAIASPDAAHAVHVEVDGLRPDREYHYRFVAMGHASATGRTRTAPARAARPRELAFALASCQAWQGGRYAAYRTMAEEELRFVLHVGDYIYEEPDTETLADFRLRYAQCKSSPDLQAAHAAHAFVAIFDDHDVENNWAGAIAQPTSPRFDDPARFRALRAAALQAYYEHLPLRRAARPRGTRMLAHRRLTFGDLLELSVLDTRQYRTDQLDETFPAAPRDPRALDGERTMTGAGQERWLLRGLDRSRVQWNAIAQQTLMAQLDFDRGEGESVNHDRWDGYVAARERILGHIARRRIENPVVLTGDAHASFVCDLKRDWGDEAAPTVATEFAGTSISSICECAAIVDPILPVNPHVRFFDGDRRGYVRCRVTRDAWRSDFRGVASADDTTRPAATLSSWTVDRGTPGARLT